MNDAEYWEPVGFAVGDRVRVLARPECFYCREDHDAEVGETGTVTRIYLPTFVEGTPSAGQHIVWVAFDDPTIVERTLARSLESHFAPSELILISEEPHP